MRFMEDDAGAGSSWLMPMPRAGLVVWLFLGACGPLPEPVAVLQPAPPPEPVATPCSDAQQEHERAAALAAEGHPLRALRIYEGVAGQCPAVAPAAWQARLTLLADLGADDEARALAAIVEAAADAPPAALERAALLLAQPPAAVPSVGEAEALAWGAADGWARARAHVALHRATGVEPAPFVFEPDGSSESPGLGATARHGRVYPDGESMLLVERAGATRLVPGEEIVALGDDGTFLVGPAPHRLVTGEGEVTLADGAPLVAPTFDRGELFAVVGDRLVAFRRDGSARAEQTVGEQADSVAIVGDRVVVHAPTSDEPLHDYLLLARSDLAIVAKIAEETLVTGPKGTRALALPAWGGDPPTVLDLRTGKVERRLRSGAPNGSIAGPPALALSEDERFAALESGRRFEVVDLASGAVESYQAPDPGEEDGHTSTRPSFSADDRYVCFGHDSHFHGIVDRKARRVLASPPGFAVACLQDPAAHVFSIPLSPGFELMEDVAYDGVVDTWNPFGGGYDGDDVALAADGHTLVAVEQGPEGPDGERPRNLLVLDVPALSIRLRVPIAEPMLTGDSLRIDEARGVAELQVLGPDRLLVDLRTGTQSRVPNPDEPARLSWHAEVAGPAAFWSEGTPQSAHPSTVHALRVDGSTIAPIEGTCLATLSPSGTFLATKSCKGEVVVVTDLARGRRAEVALGSVLSLAASDDGRTVAGETVSEVRVGVVDGGDVRVVASGVTDRIALSPSGTWLATAAGDRLQLFDTAAPAAPRWTLGPVPDVAPALRDEGGLDQGPLRFVDDATLFVGRHAFGCAGGACIERAGPVSLPQLAAARSARSPRVRVDVLAGGRFGPDGALELEARRDVVRLIARADGATRALLLPDGSGALALFDGYFERLGRAEGELALRCRSGAVVVPFAVCEDRWEAPRGLAHLTRGQPHDAP